MYRLALAIILSSFACCLTINYIPFYEGALQITHENVDNILASNELVILNFYVNSCRFSLALNPIYEELAHIVPLEYPEAGKILLGKVDCETEVELKVRFEIWKFPSVLILRRNQMAHREYKGRRTLDDMMEFIRAEMKDPIEEFEFMIDIDKVLQGNNRKVVIGIFDTKDSLEYAMLKRAAMNYKEDCKFYVRFGTTLEAANIYFKPDETRTNDKSEVFKGNASIFIDLNTWVGAKCTPLINEITFGNAQEFTEERRPFVVLFYKPNEHEIIKTYDNLVKRELLSEISKVKFLTADAITFNHPLSHLGKNISDIPLLCIDDFKHMYLFPNISELDVPGKVMTFLQDLYSGHLHYQFHYRQKLAVHGSTTVTMELPRTSTFVKLRPTKYKYTLTERDEL